MSKTSHNSVGQIRSRLPQFFYQKILREQSVDVELIDQQHGKSQSSLPNKRSPIWPRCLSPCTNPLFWETISAIFSLLCLTAIFVILAVYNNSPSPSLPHGVTLNAIVSILATGSKASLIFVTSESIRQLKWIWFRTRRTLVDMQLLIMRVGGLGDALYFFTDIKDALWSHWEQLSPYLRLHLTRSCSNFSATLSGRLQALHISPV